MFVEAFSLHDRKKLSIERRQPSETDANAFGSAGEFPGGFPSNANHEKHAVNGAPRKAASILIFKTSRLSGKLVFKLVRVDASKNFSSSRGLLRACGREPRERRHLHRLDRKN